MSAGTREAEALVRGPGAPPPAPRELRAGALNHGLAPRESLIVVSESLASVVYAGLYGVLNTTEEVVGLTLAIEGELLAGAR